MIRAKDLKRGEFSSLKSKTMTIYLILFFGAIYIFTDLEE